MIGFLVRGKVRIKIGIRVRVGVTFNVRVSHWSNCRRSKCIHSFSSSVRVCFILVFVYVALTV